MNELDKAIRAVQRTAAAAPELYRQLTTGELCFLLPYHPEMEIGGRMSVQNGSPFPFCIQTETDGREVVPIFSSEARVEESLQRGQVPPNKFLCGAMPAVQVLELIGKTGFAAVLNRGCTTGEITLPPDLLCDLADGSIFQSPGPVETKQAAVTILDPAEYPTDLVQRAFDFIRHHPEFRAAWVFLLPENTAAAGETRKYQLLFLMKEGDPSLLHDLNLALNSIPPANLMFEFGTIEDNDPVQIMTLFAKAHPFYLAQDYPPPRPPAE